MTNSAIPPFVALVTYGVANPIRSPSKGPSKGPSKLRATSVSPPCYRPLGKVESHRQGVL